MIRVLGIDPGYDRAGWAVLDLDGTNTRMVSCGAITTPKTMTIPMRIQLAASKLEEIIKTYTPQRAQIESLFFASNQKTAINVAQARGAILYVCGRHNLQILEFTPLQVKSSVTGDGRATKEAVEKMVRLLVKHLPEKLLDDTLDAIAIALVVS